MDVEESFMMAGGRGSQGSVLLEGMPFLGNL